MYTDSVFCEEGTELFLYDCLSKNWQNYEMQYPKYNKTKEDYLH